ncbi:amino acid adenylation domain-containing protein [Pyxidicoccus parkwayensis]|uniref:Amino acid adenylation domain-containing protein n=1 Tax=Pyxidicoccus parkwayensis TaxID=2813578 RepID=A0ABX7NLY6_9BACT|nr:non-ribosomal peptide synthetase [Pyxidicoccus parkwaysis]QSQ19871.1 amino acid adenylation domain-containing protein [Pyxidicoccus parkwaysis]
MSAHEPKPTATRSRRPPPVVPAPRGPATPLSFAQQRMWFLAQLDPEGFAYNAPFFARLKGPLDVAALERALAEVVRRHEALRTTFAEVEGQPVQVISPEVAVPLPVDSLEALPREEREREVVRRAEEEARLPFDLKSGPLLRARLLRVDVEDHVLLLSLHHIACDGWSLSVMEQELRELYATFHVGAEPASRALPVQYVDYALWQRGWLKGEVLDAQLAWWKEKLAGASPMLELPVDRQRPPVQSIHGKVLHVPMPAELMRAALERGKQEAVTPFMLLLAGFQALLSRYSGQRDVVVGTPISGRNRGELEGLIGFFANTLALRVDVEVEESFRSLLGRVRQTCLGAYAHQDVPFETLVDALQPVRDLSRSPLFQVMFVLQSAPPLVRLDGLRTEEVDFEPGVSKFDLTLFLRETADGWVCVWEYSTALFDEATVRRLAEHYVRLLGAAVARPETRVSELPLLSEEERRRLVKDWSGQVDASYVPGLMHEWVEAQVSRTPHAVAVTDGRESLTYAQLEAQANQLAHHLVALGVKPGGTVGLCLERSSLRMPVSVLATLKAGAAFLPLDSSYPAERLAQMLDDTGAPVVLVQGQLEEALPRDLQARVVRLEEEAERIDARPTHALKLPLSPETNCYFVYTSGSTGRPKGIVMSHRAIGNQMRWLLTRTVDPGATTLQFASLNFDVSFQELFGTWFLGGRVLLISAAVRRDPLAMLRFMREHRVGRLFLPFVALQAFCEAAQDEEQLPPLNEVVTAGEQLHVTPALVSVFERLPGCVLENQYGPSEAHVVTAWRATGAPSTWPALPPIGAPIHNVQIYVLDERGEPCPVGVVGEVYVGGASVAHGYHNRPDLTADRFVPDALSGQSGARLYRTGDKARWLGDGNLEFLGRLDGQVKVRGFRVELGEVEVALRALPGVKDAAVVVKDEEAGAKRLVGYVVQGADEAWDVEALKRQLGRRLPEYMVPSVLMRLDALPLTPSGKVDRKALPAPDIDREELGSGYEAPRTPLERQLAQVWEEVLGVRPVGVRDDFFGMGGHSLLATRVVSRLREVLGREVPVRLLFESPTVAGLSERLRELALSAPPPSRPPLLPAPRNGELPLSFAQQRLWFLGQLNAGGATYNLPFVLRLSGRLDVAALSRAVAQVVRRHEALRTTFPEVQGQPVQRISPELTVPVPVEALSARVGESVEDALRRRVVDAFHETFDLEHGPLLRAVLLRVTDEEHVFVLVVHHIVADGWSMDVLCRELEALYVADVKGQEPALKPLAVQYADHAAWQRDWLKDEVLVQQLAWWRAQLGGAPSVLELPADRPRPVVQTFRGASLPVRLSPELCVALRELSRRESVTPYMTLLAAFQVLLARYSGQWDVVVGSPISGRTAKEAEDLIGFFVNTLALRARMEARASFRALLRQVKETVLGAFAHQDVPFEKLVEDLRPERDLSRSPLFQVLFTLQGASPTVTLPGVSTRTWDFASTVAKFDLELLLVDSAQDAIAGQLIYNADLFEPSTVGRMADCFLELLRGLVAEPNARLGALPLLPAAERQRVLETWNATAVDFPRDACVHHLFEAEAARRPNAVALEFGAERLTYAQLEAQANQLAWALVERGVGPDVLVSVCLERSVELIVSLLAILKAGGAYVPLESSYPAQRLEQMLEDSRPRLLLTSRALLPQLPAHALPELMLVEEERLESRPAHAPRAAVGGRNLAYVDFTSGSTGRPKGVAVEHRGVLRLLYGAPYAKLGPEETFLLIAPISFDASTLEVWGPLCLGGRLVVFPPRSPSDLDLLTEVLTRHEVTLLHLTAGLFSQMVDLRMEGLRGVRQLLTGGDVVSAPHVRKTLEELRIPVTACYGPTEGTLFTSTHRMTRLEDVGTSVPIGRPIGNTQVYVLDAGFEPVPPGVAGELFIGGDGLARGYLRQPDVTADRFIPNPFSRVPGERLYRTGDLARWREDGVLEFLGRRDNQVKVRGYRIELAEVDAALLRCPGVKEGLVVVRDGVGGKRLVAYYVEQPGQSLSVSQVRESMKGGLPEFMVPSAFVKLPALPLTANGKVDRKALPAPEAEGLSAGVASAPRTAMEETVAGIWAPLLGLERVGVEDNFFTLGGHSLLATRVMSRLREVLGRDVPVRLLFESPTVAALAERLEGTVAREVGLKAPPLVPATRQGALPLSFAQQRLWFLRQLDTEGYAYNLPFVLRLKGRLDVAALSRAVEQVVRRHESLRTTFAEVQGQPVQRIVPEVTVPVPVEELDVREGEEVEAAMRRRVVEVTQKPFDLEHGPLLRAALLRLTAGEHVLVVVLHHIVADGWSMGVLSRELEALYAAQVKGEDAALDALPVQYADFAVWQREWLRGDVLEQQLAWWRGQLDGAPAVLELPTDRPRPTLQTFRGAVLTVKLSPELSAGLKELSRSEGVTLYMTLLAGYHALFARYSGQWDMVVGSPISGRTTKEVEGLIGFFVNTLALRLRATERMSFRELLHHTRESVLGAFAHQDVPFETLVEDLRLERDLSRSPLFQVAFSLIGLAPTPSLSGLSTSAVDFDAGMAKFDLALTVREDEDGLTAFWERNVALFDEVTVARMAEHFQRLLEAAVALPDALPGTLPLLNEAERHLVLVEWNAYRTEYPPNVPLPEGLTMPEEPRPEARVYVLDETLEPVPVGVWGALWLGGARLAGVPSPELFVPDPLSGEPGGRLFSTGIWGRWRPGGALEIRERLDTPARVKAPRDGGRRAAVPTLDVAALAPEGYVAPRTSMERLVATTWAPLLGLRHVGAEDHFFERGGHSLLVMQVVSRLKDVLGRDVPVRLLFEAPTVALLAERLQELVKGAPESRRKALVRMQGEEESLPLSFAQQRLWFFDRLQPQSPLYNIPLALRLEGALDVPALERTLAELVRRHESLRTTFHQDVGGGVQRIGAPAPLPLPAVDLRGVPEALREQEFNKLCNEEARRPFDLERGPLLRATLVRMGDADHVLMLVVHHIVADGWSMGVLCRELGMVYAAQVKGEEAALEAPPVQYADFAVWQRAWLKGEVLEEQLAWWRQQLEGAPAALELPIDKPRPAVQTFRGAWHWVRLPAELTARLKELSQREGVTLYMTLLAGFQVLLARYSGQWDMVLGSPISGRTTKEVEGLIGFFVNTLALRIRATGGMGFRELLHQVRETVLGAFAHQDVPFETLVDALRPVRDLSRSPVFQVVFALQNAPVSELSMPGLKSRLVDIDAKTSKVDLALSLRESPEGLEGAIEYNTDLFETATVERLGRHLERLLQALVDAPERALRDLPLMSAAEQAKVLAWGGSEEDFEADCIHRLFEAQVARTPDAVALEMEGQTLTYAQMDARANALARVLSERGVGPEVLVGLCIERGMDLVVSMFAVLKAGGAYLPMNPEHPPERLAYMLESSRAALLVAREPYASRVSYRGPTLLLNEGGLDAAPWSPSHRESAPGVAPLQSTHEVTARNLAYVIFTSGSTGRPKGTLLEHRGVANLVEIARGMLGLGPGSRVLQFAPMSFDASVWEIYPPLLTGGTVVLARREQVAPGEPLAELLARERITAATLPPSVLAVLPDVALPELKVLVSAGEACTAELVSRWGQGRRFINGYGPTESTVCTTLGECRPGERPMIGTPARNLVVRVMDEAGHLVPPGVWGELCLGGAGQARGYLGRPDLTAERFVPDPFRRGQRLYRTGDVVRFRDDGRLEYLRRADSQVKVRGVRVEPAEAREALAEHPGVQSVVVMGREDAPGETRLVAYVVPAKGETLTADVLRAWLRRSLPEHAVPSAFVVMEDIPLTPNGKPDWKALPVPDAQRPELSSGYVAPEEGVEKALAQLWAEVLKLDKVGAGDNFFDLGGNSLLLQAVHARMEARVGRKVPLVELFQFPTVRTLAAHLSKGAAPAQAAAPVASSDREDRLRRLSRQRRLRPGSD